jgi:hypothetical protein
LSYLTDTKHLAKIEQRLLGRVVDLGEMWRDEDRDACAPRRNDSVPVSGGGTSDPTFTVVTDKHRHVSRDRIGKALLAALRILDDEMARQKPQPEGKDRCSNCGWAPSTHGKRCEACDRWKRRHHGEERPRNVWEAHRDRVVEVAAQRQAS